MNQYRTACLWSTTHKEFPGKELIPTGKDTGFEAVEIVLPKKIIRRYEFVCQFNDAFLPNNLFAISPVYIF